MWQEAGTVVDIVTSCYGLALQVYCGFSHPCAVHGGGDEGENALLPVVSTLIPVMAFRAKHALLSTSRSPFRRTRGGSVGFQPGIRRWLFIKKKTLHFYCHPSAPTHGSGLKMVTAIEVLALSNTESQGLS